MCLQGAKKKSQPNTKSNGVNECVLLSREVDWPLYFRWECAISLSIAICIFFRFRGQNSSLLALFCKKTTKTEWTDMYQTPMHSWICEHYYYSSVNYLEIMSIISFFFFTYVGVILRAIICPWGAGAVMTGRWSRGFQHLSSLQKPGYGHDCKFYATECPVCTGIMNVYGP